MSLLGYGDIYCKSEWGLPEDGDYGDVYYDIATDCNGGGGTSPSGRPVILLFWDTTQSPSGGYDYTYRNLSGDLVNATLPDGTSVAYAISSEAYFSDIAITNESGTAQVISGGRRTYTSLTNISQAVPVTPTYYAKTPPSLTRSNWPQTIAPATTWTGSLELLPRPNGGFDGDTSVTSIFDDNAKTGSPVFTTQLAPSDVTP